MNRRMIPGPLRDQKKEHQLSTDGMHVIMLTNNTVALFAFAGHSSKRRRSALPATYATSAGGGGTGCDGRAPPPVLASGEERCIDRTPDTRNFPKWHLFPGGTTLLSCSTNEDSGWMWLHTRTGVVTYMSAHLPVVIQQRSVLHPAGHGE